MLDTTKPRPRASLARVIGDLGATLLELVHGDPESAVDIGGVVIHDEQDDSLSPPHALVLGVGIHSTDAICSLLEDLGPRGASALVVRGPIEAVAEVTRASAASGVAVLALTRGATWAQLAAILRSMLAEGDIGLSDSESLGGVQSGDLFAMANAVAALLDAPVTIEDRSSRILAFSEGQDDTDPSRVASILGRQVPERFSRQLIDRGIFRDLYSSDAPLYITPDPDNDEEFALPRAAVTVRAGDETLGSIWAVVREPLSEERSRALQDAAKLVALHMLRLRAGADVERRLRAELVSTALEGGVGAREALDRLGLGGHPVVIMALGLLDMPGGVPSIGADASLVTERQRLTDAFGMHLSAFHPRCATALVGDITYALVPAESSSHDAGERAVRMGTGFLERLGDRARAAVGVGPVVATTAELPVARASADRALRVLRSEAGLRRVARLEDVHVEALMLEVRDVVAARGDRPTGPIARLVAYDRQHDTTLVETLRSWLDAFGDVNSAAASVFVHPNTFRYRLRRLAEVGGLDLADPEARFAAMLQLRVVSLDVPGTGRS